MDFCVLTTQVFSSSTFLNSHSCSLNEINPATEVSCLSISETEHDLQAQLKNTYMILFSVFEIRLCNGSDQSAEVTSKSAHVS